MAYVVRIQYRIVVRTALTLLMSAGCTLALVVMGTLVEIDPTEPVHTYTIPEEPEFGSLQLEKGGHWNIGAFSGALYRMLSVVPTANAPAVSVNQENRPWWSALSHLPASSVEAPTFRTYMEIAYGWPLPAMARLHAMDLGSSGATLVECRWCLPEGLPGRLIIRGFVADTALFFVLLNALITSTRRGRTAFRRRTGRCTQCGYQLSAQGRCPECGFASKGSAT